jgi:hypothetical protein
MTDQDEARTRDLIRGLWEALGSTQPDSRVGVEKICALWHCIASRGDRSGSVHCSGRVYYVTLHRGGRTVAEARTRSKGDVIGSVAAWLEGPGIEDLYERFPFVDREKRALKAIRAEVVRCRPELGRLAPARVGAVSWGPVCIWYVADDRSCRIGFDADDEVADTAFHWDECPLLRVRTGDTTRLAAMLARWLCDRALPSAMAREFPEADVMPVARYYEERRPVEGEFLTSWDAVGRFFARFLDDPRFPQARRVLDLIASIRRAGYDRVLRAGQSMYDLGVSRSRRHGLRDDQPRIFFEFHEEGMEVHCDIDGRERFSLPRIELSPEVEAVLTRLAAREID